MQNGIHHLQQQLAQNIKRCRKNAGLTQQKVADAVYRSLKTYQSWENGVGCPDILELHSLAEALQVPPVTMLTGILDFSVSLESQANLVQESAIRYADSSTFKLNQLLTEFSTIHKA